MGSSASKGARTAGDTIRKYPTRVPNTTTTKRPPAPSPAQPSKPNYAASVRPSIPASETKSRAIDLDARDPAFASRLNSLGAVQPNPHFSPSSTSTFDPQRNEYANIIPDMMTPPPPSAYPDRGNNPALRILDSRQKIQDEADSDLEMMGRRGFQGRKYIDAGILQLALVRKKRGESDAKIEQAFDIKRGRLSVLGKGIVEAV